MIFNLIKRKSVIIIFFLLLISENISSRNFINILVGVNFNEEAYTAIYHNQIAPKISFTYINERQIDFFSLKHNVCFDFLIWNFYNRNGLLYFTDKTLTIEAPIEYSFTASVPSNFNIRFMFGLGFQHNTRFDRYSMGVYFWFSRLKIEPILFGVMGAELVFSNFNISFRHSIGYLVSTFILHNKEEFFLYTLSHDLFNRFELSINYKVSDKFGIMVKWNHKFNLYSDLSLYITNFMLFQNSLLIGFNYEI